MAWNDIYQTDDKAVQLLVTVNGKQFKFRHAVDLKVERKIGDTMSKFSLGIVGDDSEDFYNFEQQILKYGTEIKISYGNSTRAMSNFIGIIIDYQPVFLGNSTKLTVTGYLSKIVAGVDSKKLTSAYTYWIDWTPLIGVREYDNKEWAEIYNGNFRFDQDMSVEGLEVKDEQILKEDEANKIIDEYIKKYEDAADVKKQIMDAAEEEYSKAKLDNVWETGNFTDINYGGMQGKLAEYDGVQINYTNGKTEVKMDPLGPAVKMKNPFYIPNSFNNPGIPEYIMVKYTDLTAAQMRELGIERVISFKKGAHIFKRVDGTMYVDNNYTADASQSVKDAEAKYQEAKNQYNKAHKAYIDLYEKLKDIYSKDTWGKLSGLQWDHGHVPWTEVITKYQGNVKFGPLTHPITKNTIYRVRPDLFIEWDNDLPGAPEYINDRSDGRSDEKIAEEFPDSAINDIKVFGLKYYFNKDEYANNKGNPYAAYSLSAFDMHGKLRVFNANNKYYIWVGDVPELYEKWKANDFKYNEKKDEAGKVYLDYKTFNSGGSFKKGQTVKNNSYYHYTYRTVVGDSGTVY